MSKLICRAINFIFPKPPNHHLQDESFPDLQRENALVLRAKMVSAGGWMMCQDLYLDPPNIQKNVVIISSQFCDVYPFS
jgi:hypothetical protein